MNPIRKRLTYANVMSTIAVFLALGGVAVAAGGLPANSVGARQLRKNAVRTGKLRNGSVTGAKIRSEAISAEKLASGAVTTEKIADGSVISAKLADGSVLTGTIADGAITGAKLAGGAVTASKLSGSPYKLFSGISAPPEPEAEHGVSSHEVECPAGTRMLSGGLLNDDPELRLLATHPNGENTWRVTVLNESATEAIEYAMVVICLQ